MVLPKTIYESLPFSYFSLSFFLFVIADSWSLLLSASLFYCIACITLVTRSAHRRKDKRKRSPLKSRLPELLYEYLPYVYGGVAIFIIMASRHEASQFLAFGLSIVAMRNIICRHNNRMKSPSLF